MKNNIKKIFNDILIRALENQMEGDKSLNKDEIDKMIKTLVDQRSSYNRIFSNYEQKFITPEAYGYLFNLLKNDSISKAMFEKIALISIELSTMLNQKMDKTRIDDILNYLMFTGDNEAELDEIYDIFIMKENKTKSMTIN